MTTKLAEPRDQATHDPEAALSLPSSTYADPTIYGLEHERIFRRSWLYVANATTIPCIGDFIAHTVAGVPIVVVRTGSGELAAFLNACRHRLHQVAEGQGTTKAFQCRYHGWTYDISGGLTGAPRSRFEDSFDKESLGLVPVALDTWGPLIFINFDADAAPLRETLTSLPDLAVERGLNFDLTLHCREEVPLGANWKVAVDNGIECYHCPTVHPGLSKTFDLSLDGVAIEIQDSTMTMLSTPRGGREDDADVTANGGASGLLHGYFVWPNLWISGRGNESYFVIQFNPVDVGNCTVLMEHYYRADEDPDHVAANIEGTRTLIDEDTQVCESVQCSHVAGLSPRGRLLLNSEEPLRWFAETVQERVTA